jgi:hypothetical protein
MSLVVQNLSLGVPGGGGGISQIDTGNTAWVDGANGDDGTALVGRQDLQFATIGAALAAVSSGQAVAVRPGTYAESGLTVAAGVRLVSCQGWQVTAITGAAATGTRVTLAGNGSSIEGFKVTVPTDAAYGVETTAGAGEVGSVFFCTFVGQAGSVGYGLGQTGAGKTISLELRFAGGEAAGLTLCSAGVLATQGNHIPGGATLGAAWTVTGGRFQGLDLNCGSPTVTDALQQSGGTVRVFTANWFNVTNAIHFTGNAVDCSVQNGEFDSVTLGVLVDPALTLAGAVIRISANHQPLYSFPPAALNADFAVATFQRDSSSLDSAYDLFGVPLSVGFPEKGVLAALGEGQPYTTGLACLSTDATGAAGYIDRTAEAVSKTGSLLEFQGTAAGHCLMWCSQRFDSTGAKLKHWGLKINQVGAASGGSFVFEIYDGAAWQQVGIMATSSAESYRYANQIFLRANSTEDLRFGIDDNTTWASATFGAYTGHWSRVRIVTAPATAPTFEQTKLHASCSITSARGVVSSLGLGQLRGIAAAGGGIFGEDGTVVASAQTVGAAPNQYTHISPDSLLNSNGDACMWQAIIPPQINTAFPLSVSVLVAYTGAGSVTTFPTGAVTLTPTQTSGVLIADPAGGILPIKRSSVGAQTLTTSTAQVVSQLMQPEGATTGAAAIDDQQHLIEFGPFDVSAYAPGDMLYLRFELIDDGAPNYDIFLGLAEVSGVIFEAGTPI